MMKKYNSQKEIHIGAHKGFAYRKTMEATVLIVKLELLKTNVPKNQKHQDTIKFCVNFKQHPEN